MIKQLAFLVAFIVTGGMATMLWKAVFEQLPFALQDASLYGCTFSCNSHAMSVVWSGLGMAILFTAVAIGVLCMMASHKSSRMG